ncbi:MAG: cbb3-type cytochrome c oxidase subunit 3 [Saprospiraceae bacterium]|nr:cbb3-type cytochrome c oxidase subunit 3 [Saprospiraceae bacterium]
MYKYILQSIENINWLAIGPLLIFFIFFVYVTISTLIKKKSFIDHMGQLPLVDDKEEQD